eukprot:16081-Heterococcus_DN1.PRE.1
MGGDGGSGGALSNILSGTVAGFAQVAAGKMQIHEKTTRTCFITAPCRLAPCSDRIFITYAANAKQWPVKHI